MWARTIRYGRAIRYPKRNAHTRKRDPKLGDDMEIGLNKPVERTVPAFLDKQVVREVANTWRASRRPPPPVRAFRALVTTSREAPDHSAPRIDTRVSPISPPRHNGGQRPLTTPVLGVWLGVGSPLRHGRSWYAQGVPHKPRGVDTSHPRDAPCAASLMLYLIHPNFLRNRPE